MSTRQDDDDNNPDWADVSDWCYQNAREIWEATKYLSPSVQYRLHLAAWEQAGKPHIEGEMADDQGL